METNHMSAGESLELTAAPETSARRLRILQIVPTTEEEASGPAYSVPRLCAALGTAGHELKLASVSGVSLSEAISCTHYVAVREWSHVPVLKKLWRSGDLRRHLLLDAQWAEIVHSNGLWVMPSVYPALAARAAGKALVLSPRGTLNAVALKRGRWRKRIFWASLQGRAVRSAACLHATSEKEYHEIRNVGLRQPVAVVPNGIDIPPRLEKVRSARRTLLYLGRIHRIKGLDNLFRAWGEVQAEFPEWDLRVVGPDEGNHRADLERLIQAAALLRITFAGPRYGADKNHEYSAADAYVLPSFTENFGVSVAEALAQGVPVITTTGTPWSGLSEHGCGWIVPPTAAGIEGALREALCLDHSHLAVMGQRARAWMERDFSWERVAKAFEQTYRWILGDGVLPDFVKLD
jgi:glycosyltransferase involved in cell wall biosynthesis